MESLKRFQLHAQGYHPTPHANPPPYPRHMQKLNGFAQISWVVQREFRGFRTTGPPASAAPEQNVLAWVFDEVC